jgi:uncharacterized membrane protein
MSEGIERYLNELRNALAGTDPATAQDAVADASEHLQTALAQAHEVNPGQGETEALASILEQYGTPAEVAKAYQELENRMIPAFAPLAPPAIERTRIQRFFGVLIDPRAYAALFFMLFSMIMGIVTFTWVITGLSLSVGFMVLIIGLPFFGLFIFSIQGLALVEGRLIEALLGIRMPRRAAVQPRGTGLWGKFVARLNDRRTWTTLFYFILKMPLGVLSFSVFIVLLAWSVELMLLPILQYVLGVPLIVIDDLRFFVPIWFTPILMIAGFLDLVVILHLAKAAGRGYGGLAKAMLVKD